MTLLRWPLEEVVASAHHRLLLRAEHDERTSLLIEASLAPHLKKSDRRPHEVHPLLRSRNGH